MEYILQSYMSNQTYSSARNNKGVQQPDVPASPLIETAI